MPAITLINRTSDLADFHLSQGSQQLARVGVHAGGQTSVPIVVDNDDVDGVVTAQQWQMWAIINGITTQNVTVTNPDATVTVSKDHSGGYTLTVE